MPEGVSPEDAAKFASVLNKLIADDDELKNDAAVKKLKALSRTSRSKEIINWRGGGGFQVAHLSPECFDYIPELNRVILTEEYMTGNRGVDYKRTKSVAEGDDCCDYRLTDARRK